MFLWCFCFLSVACTKENFISTWARLIQSNKIWKGNNGCSTCILSQSLYVSFSYFWVSNVLLHESVLRHNSHSISSWLNCIMQVLLSQAFSALIMMIILATIDQNLHLFWKPKTPSLELHGRSRYSNRTQKYNAEVVKKNKKTGKSYECYPIWWHTCSLNSEGNLRTIFLGGQIKTTFIQNRLPKQ